MDPVVDIKARLPIETLVGQYCHLQKKGRGFVCLCPFHKDTHPSLIVSPDKGIAYCFACQKGGDIFSFYQAIEGVDFREAIKDLGEKVGVDVLVDKGTRFPKDEKEEIRRCLDASVLFFRRALECAPDIQAYLRSRGVAQEEDAQFELGFAPDGGRALYEHLLKSGFSRTTIKNAGLAMQRDLKDEDMRDTFRYRVMFPIHDGSGRIIGFGGRAMRDNDPKYINSPESPLYRKSSTLFNLHRAKEYIREKREVILVEGYFDALAVSRAGFGNVIAQCGTALTEEHVRIIKRYADTVSLLLDQDTAGRKSAERAFMLLCPEGIAVHSIILPKKDPADLAQEDVSALQTILLEGARPYLSVVLDELPKENLQRDVAQKHRALVHIAPLLCSVPSAVEREHYIVQFASILGTTDTAVHADIENAMTTSFPSPSDNLSSAPKEGVFSTLEITLGLFCLYPQHRSLLSDLIVPVDGLEKTLYDALGLLQDSFSFEHILSHIPKEFQERIGILQLFCEQHFEEWTQSLAIREIKRNIRIANQDTIRMRQYALKEEILLAKNHANTADLRRLEVQYQEIIKLRKLACR